MPRTLTISIEPKVGQIHDVTLTVGADVVLAQDGSKKRSWSGDITDAKVHVKIFVTGVPGSQYVMTVDLPGTANDFGVKYTLGGTTQALQFEA